MREGSNLIPQDLLALRLWIDRLASDYERILSEERTDLRWRERRAHRKALRSLKRTCRGGPEGSAKNRIRELIAVGIVRYGIAQAPLPQGRVPRQVIVDFTTFALWPLVITPNLTQHHFRSLAEITSQPLANLVWNARLTQGTPSTISVAAFARKLAETELAPGILNLLGDLCDPLRGGTALIAINLAATGTLPPSRRSPKAMVAWILSAAAAGIIGNRTDAEWTTLWHWLISKSAPNPTEYNQEPGRHHYIWNHDSPRSHPPDEHKVSTVGQIIHDIIHWYS